MTKPLSKEELREKIAAWIPHAESCCSSEGACICDCERIIKAIMSLVWPQIEEPRELIREAYDAWCNDHDQERHTMSAIRDHLAECEKGAKQKPEYKYQEPPKTGKALRERLARKGKERRHEE